MSIDTVSALYLAELQNKLSIDNYFCRRRCTLFGRVMVQNECPQLFCPRYCECILFGRVMVQIEFPFFSSILSVHFIWKSYGTE